MTCRECELFLTEDHRPAAVQAHLDECPDCRALAAELEANSAALSELRDVEWPPEALGVRRARQPHDTWTRAAAIAAMLAIAIAAAWLWRAQPGHQTAPPAVRTALVPERELPQRGLPAPELPDRSLAAPVPAPPKRDVLQAAARNPSQPLKIKMLTDDPDVVIYWLIDPSQEE
jgi:hypothetical protein